MATLQDLERWITEPEGEHLEFKEAKSKYDFEKLTKYCCALANEGGGHIILGVADKRPRKVVGSSAFQEIERTRSGLIQRLHISIQVSELTHENGRVLVFEIPSRPVGTAIEYCGAYWMRSGEDLVAMTPDLLRKIFAEGQPDFSSEICESARLSDLDERAIEVFRSRWMQKSGRKDLEQLPPDRLLEDAELLSNGKVTKAALLLLGKEKALADHLARAEIVFEYRADDASIPYQDRKEFRAGFLLIQDNIWAAINLRNPVFPVREGLFKREIRAFNQDAVREGILNAFCHRDYRLEGSIFVKQYSTRTEIISPGGFPPEITTENILFRQSPRNRRLAEACGKCGLVERSGQGVDLMFASSVSEGKLPPDYTGTDSYHVSLTLHGQVQDVSFLEFLEKVTSETGRNFRTDDLVVLDAIHRRIPIPRTVESRVTALIDLGVVERVTRRQIVLSKRYYSFVGKRGEYTRRKGLSKATKVALLVQHIEANAGKDGCPISELMQVLPELSRWQIHTLLKTIKRESKAHAKGTTRNACWFPGPKPSGS